MKSVTRPHARSLHRSAIGLVLAATAVAAPAHHQTVLAEIASETTSASLPGPTGSVNFGEKVLVLENGNYAVLDNLWENAAGDGVGALHLYDGRSDALISSLTGSTADDLKFAEMHEVGDSHLVLASTGWANGDVDNAGAVTWIDGVRGLSGEVEPSNSFVGTSSFDAVGRGLVTLTNGNYVVSAQSWDNGEVDDAGAATWFDGNLPMSGEISVANSLVGTSVDGSVGEEVVALANGDYVVASTDWSNGDLFAVGAVTLGDGATGIVGEVSAANSLIGDHEYAEVGESVIELMNGNFVVGSPSWRGDGLLRRGAATLVDADIGTVGVVTAQNSLVGAQSDDRVGASIVPLPNGNYVVASIRWSNGSAAFAGAVTWGDGADGVVGLVGPGNSLVGSSANDRVGSKVNALPSGNYVVSTDRWDDGAVEDVGAVTWGDGTSGIAGPVSEANSLVGTRTSDRIGRSSFGVTGVTVLSNGNYVVESVNWARNDLASEAGAVTWADGATGVFGQVSEANSLVGQRGDVRVGSGGVTALTNGNYVVASPLWFAFQTSARGAVTWGDGSTGTVGDVDFGNSLVGTAVSDQAGSGGAFALANGHYVIASPGWDGPSAANVGAVTWADGSVPTTGAITEANSLVGSQENDAVGSSGVRPLVDGNYVAGSAYWNSSSNVKVGAATWLDGSRPSAVVVSRTNSLVGSSDFDQIGFDGFTTLGVPSSDILELPLDGDRGGYLVWSPSFETPSNPVAGSVAFGRPGTGVTGVITATNSAIGDGGMGAPITRLTSGDAVVVPNEANRVLLLRLDRSPVFGATSNVLYTAAVGAPDAIVEFDDPIADDVRDGLIQSSCMPSSGSVFPVGDTTVTCTATDSKGQSATASFTVTVSEPEPEPGPDVSAEVVSLNPGRAFASRVSDETIDGLFEGDGRVLAGAFVEVDIAGRAGVAADAEAVVMNVTAINPSGRGFATAYPCGTRPLASSLNYGGAGAVVGNELIAKLGSTGELCVYTSAETDLTIDVVGYVPASSEVVSLDPARVYATRATDETVDGQQEAQGRVAAGAFVEVEIAGRAMVPGSGAGAVVMNITAINPSGRGFITAYPCGQRPLASSLNFGAAGAVVGNELIAKLSTEGTVCVYSSASTDLTVDVVGYVPSSSAATSLDPARVYATRSSDETVDGQQEAQGRVAAGSFVEVEVAGRAMVPGSGAGAVVMNITAINPDGRGFITTYPCGDRPLASSLNYSAAGAVVGNELVAKLSGAGSVCIYSSAATDLTVDVVGYVPA